ncbi:SH3 domain-containing protein [Celeribacter sp. SCSIO 80788]|uniref:SH3 domain-containing protein n=1 Tax=Celeribacter sp. SCSIO 80788 TaxID=3117013 RepID=UPI003DA49539
MTTRRTIFATALRAAMGAALLGTPIMAAAQTHTAPSQTAVMQADYVVKPGVTLNARSGPGTGYHAVTTFAPGTPLTALESSRGWVKVSAHGTAPLWVSAAYLDPAPQPQGLKVIPQAKPDPSKPAFEGSYPLVIRQ